MGVILVVGYNIETDELTPLLVYQEFCANCEMLENLFHKAYDGDGFDRIKSLNLGSIIYEYNACNYKTGVLIKVEKEYDENGKVSFLDIQVMEVSGVFETKCSLQKVAKYLQNENTNPNKKYFYVEIPGRGFL